jgi:hypothetical protein
MALLQLGIDAGMTPDGPEMSDLEGVSLLLTDTPVLLTTWLAALELPTRRTQIPGLAMENEDQGQETDTLQSARPSPPPAHDLDEPTTQPPPSSSPPPSSILHPTNSQPPIPQGSPAPVSSIRKSTTPFDDPSEVTTPSNFESGGDRYERSVSAPLIHEVPHAGERPRTGGKSIELLQSIGLTGRKRVRLILGEEGRGESQREGDGEAGGSKTHQHRAQRKRRRISSAATVVSDDESRERSGRGLIDEHRTYDGWVTVESERSCAHCAGAGVLCKSFILRSRGAPRFACCRCHDMKKMCEFTKGRRLAHVSRIRGRKGSDGEDDTEADGAAKPQRSRATTRIKRSTGGRAKSHGDADRSGSGSDEDDNGGDSDPDETERKREASRKRKGKGKGKERARSKSKSRREFSPIKIEWNTEESQAEWAALKDRVTELLGGKPFYFIP